MITTQLLRPAAPAVVLVCVGAVVTALYVAGHTPVLLAWVVLALAAGYAISGSV